MLLTLFEELGETISKAPSLDELHEALARACHTLSFERFALTIETGHSHDGGGSTLVHDYPAAWADVYLGFNLAASDPVRRAAEHSLLAFRWREIRQIIPMTEQEKNMFEVGQRFGIVDGLTVPRHLPGTVIGSCTFVSSAVLDLPREILVAADALGATAIARASNLSGWPTMVRRARLTDRQRDCVLWAARGKTDWEISRILGVSHETVIQHLRDARDRYDAHKRASLILHAMFDGLISFADVFRWRDR